MSRAAINLTQRQRDRLGRATVVTGAIVAVAATGGTAYAYWTTAGAGSGGGTVATMTIESEALVAGGNANAKLYPGGSADAIIRLKNPNAFYVHVTNIVAGSAVAGNSCAPTDVTFQAPASYAAAQFTLAGDGASVLLRLDSAVQMGTASASSCQGQTFSLPVTVTVQR